MPSTLTICSSLRITMPVRASTYVARREGVPSAWVPPVSDLPRQARRGAGGVDDELGAPRHGRRRGRRRCGRCAPGRLRVAAVLAIAASVPSGQRRGQRLADAVPAAGGVTVDDEVAADHAEAVQGAVEPHVRAAVRVDEGRCRRRRPGRRCCAPRRVRCSAARASDTTSARTAAGAPCAVEAVVSGSAAAAAAATASAASPAVLRMDGAFREVGRAPEWPDTLPNERPRRRVTPAGAPGRRSAPGLSRCRGRLQPDGEARVVADGADARRARRA